MLNYIRFFLRWSYRLISGKNSFAQVHNYIKYRLSKKNKEIVNYKPIRLGIFTKYECNLNCHMCLTHSPLVPDNPYKYRGAREMDFETFKGIIKRFQAALGCCFIGNGEPLLCRDLFKMIEYAHNNKMYTQIFTNGLELNEFIDKIISSSLNSVNVSINSNETQDYKRITGLDVRIFERIIENTKYLINARNKHNSKLKISATIIIDKFNYKNIPQMIGFGENLNLDYLGFLNILPSLAPGYSARERCLFADDKDIYDFFKWLKIPKTNMKVELPILLDGNTDNRICRDSFESMSIDGNGDVNGCERQLLNSQGNGKYYDKDVFNNAHFRKLRRTFLYSNIPLPQPCQFCYNNSQCKDNYLDDYDD